MNNILAYLQNNNDTKLLIVSNDKEANVASDLSYFCGKQPFVLSDFRANFGDDLLSFSDELKEITSVLGRYHKYKKQNSILIAPIRTISYALPKKECFDNFLINFADTLNIQSLKDKLFSWGYHFVDIVTSDAEVSIRGDIIDIYPPSSEFSYRISLFDNDVESIRIFDIQTQKSSKDELDSIDITPAFLALDSKHLNKIDEKILNSCSDAFIKDIHSLGFWYLDDLAKYYTDDLSSAITKEALSEIEEAYIFDEKRIAKNKLLCTKPILNDDTYKQIEPQDIEKFINLHNDKKITIISSTEARLRSFNILKDSTKYNIVYEPWIINLLSNDQVIISLNKSINKKRRKQPRIVIDELQIGNMVVHQDYGIGRFEGIEPIIVMGSKRDFVRLLYANDDKLFVPVDSLDVIDRYVANSGDTALLDKLGKGSFAKLKARVKDKLFAIANEIIQLAANRELINGIKIDTQKEELKLFEHQAGFEYTKDQKKSIKELFYDINNGIVMDRLLSGDVGFGKTEVALNGILATCLNKYQSIFICPTTLLSSQHFESLKNRLEPYGIKIAKIDGRTNTKDKIHYKKEFENGNIDVLIGTHSLLNIKSNNLALIVIDEEHKFGVKQKEKLKDLRSNVHIFSMSATPIPRTLNLAMSKIKGMSSLHEAPSSRLGVRSYVKEYNDQLIKEVVLREKRRGGQIFYIHNSIANIDIKKDDLLDILPTLKIAIIHSKIKPVDAQKTMEDFENGHYDLLLATSIVESGLHLPNANTMIIDGADRFGIADLHQLRGRVGRGSKEGFCYFVVADKKQITDDATRRLLALESNSYLGSGTALAHQDLEIRGGGNIIGEAQSGHIKQIGYGLYLKMLENALSNLSNETTEKTTVDIKLSISAYISSEFITEDRIRLELYRRLSHCSTKISVYEIQDEMEDRFGKLDTPTIQFIELIIIKILAIDKEISTISNFQTNITIINNDGNKDIIKSQSKDDDDLLHCVTKYLNK